MGDKVIEMLISNSANYLISGLFVYLNYQIKQMQNDRKQKAEMEAKARERQEKVDLWLLKKELREDLNESLAAGFVTAKSLADLEEGFKLYTEMGGNGEVKIKMEKVRKLPLKEEV